MLKVIAGNAWDGSLYDSENPREALLKRSSRGIMDKQAFVKRACASSKEFLEKLVSIDVKPGEELVHLIALGTTEAYGPNRNGDGFSRRACLKYHPGFVKNARVYRDHKNTDKSKSYGVVKASAFNDAMQRVELIVALNSTPAAAKANGGLVADKEMEKLASGSDIPVSMACFLRYNFPILTKKQGYIPIADIRPGDEVWTKDSGWKPVTRIHRRAYTGNVITLRIPQLPFPIEVTGDHLFWAQKQGAPGWIHARELAPGDKLFMGYVPDYPERTALIQELGPRPFSLSDLMLLRDCNFETGKNLRIVMPFLDYTLVGDFEPADTSKPLGCEILFVEQSYADGCTVYNFEVQDDPSYSAAGLISHNCSVPFDICSCCGNKAATQSEYCKGTHEGGHCKAGGLKHNMGRLVSVDGELKQLYADNTQPEFFDISHVFIPADRIAYSSGRLMKTAGASSRELSGSELAEVWRLVPKTASSRRGMLASNYLKSAVDAFHAQELWTKRASFLGVMTSKPLTDIHIPKRYKFAALQKALTDRGVCLSATQFVQLAGDLSADKAAIAGEIIAPISNDILQKQAFSYTGFEPEKSAPQELYTWVVSQKLPSVKPENFLKQAALNATSPAKAFTMSTEDVYAMGEDPELYNLAQTYALYKTAFVAALPEAIQETAAELIVGRDYLSF